MTGGDDELELSTKLGSVILRTGPISAAVAKTGSDIISPISEAFGFIGDRIRIFREANIKKLIESTERKIKDNNITDISIDHSFIIPFIEKISINYEESQLQELWDNLFISEIHNKSRENIIFIDILSKLTKEDADTIDDIAMRPITNIGALSQLPDAPLDAKSNRTHRIARKFDQRINWKLECAKIIFCTECRGIALTRFFVWDNEKSDSSFSYIRKGSDESKLDYHVDRLRSLGLIELKIETISILYRYELSYEYVNLTYVGVEFFYSTHNIGLKTIPSERQPGIYGDENCLPKHGETFYSLKLIKEFQKTKAFKDGILGG